MCYVKTGRLLETNRYFNLDPEPLKALQSPFFVRNLLESSWKSPYLYQGRAFTCEINGEKQFSRTLADRIGQSSFQLVARRVQILRLDHRPFADDKLRSNFAHCRFLSEVVLPVDKFALQTSLKSSQVFKACVRGISPGRFLVSQLTSFPVA